MPGPISLAIEAGRSAVRISTYAAEQRAPTRSFCSGVTVRVASPRHRPHDTFQAEAPTPGTGPRSGSPARVESGEGWSLSLTRRSMTRLVDLALRDTTNAAPGKIYDGAVMCARSSPRLRGVLLLMRFLSDYYFHSAQKRTHDGTEPIRPAPPPRAWFDILPTEHDRFSTGSVYELRPFLAECSPAKPITRIAQNRPRSVALQSPTISFLPSGSGRNTEAAACHSDFPVHPSIKPARGPKPTGSQPPRLSWLGGTIVRIPQSMAWCCTIGAQDARLLASGRPLRSTSRRSPAGGGSDAWTGWFQRRALPAPGRSSWRRARSGEG